MVHHISCTITVGVNPTSHWLPDKLYVSFTQKPWEGKGTDGKSHLKVK